MITFSKTTEYAFRIMGYMSQNNDRMHNSEELFEQLDIPFRYLRRLLTTLSNKGLLQSIKGKKGGFKLVKDLSEISLLDIVLAVEDDKKKNECFFGYEKCPLTNRCSMHDKWKNIQSSINETLHSTTLEEIKKYGVDKFI